MIHEFQRIVPVETPVGYGSLLYVESGGPLSNDIFAVVLERRRQDPALPVGSS
jgi:hypothetical protein